MIGAPMRSLRRAATRARSRSTARSAGPTGWAALNGLSYANIQRPPGLPIGTDQEGASSFAMSYWYVPTVVELLIVIGVLAFGALLFTAAVIALPMQEPDAH